MTGKLGNYDNYLPCILSSIHLQALFCSVCYTPIIHCCLASTTACRRQLLFCVPITHVAFQTLVVSSHYVEFRTTSEGYFSQHNLLIKRYGGYMLWFP
jgi:hypothetical protein